MFNAALRRLAVLGSVAAITVALGASSASADDANLGVAEPILYMANGPMTTSSGPAAWSYSGETGPAHWGHLDPAYIKCIDGTAQTPINITKPVVKNLANLKFTYNAGEAEVFNNGHTVEAEPAADATASSMTVNGVTYPFAQFHFHAPSEHVLNGKRYPLEIHFVHKTADGKIAVVGVFVKHGAYNKAWAPFVKKILKATANPEDTAIELDWAKLLPKNQQTYRYDGSLTTPGCAEGVKWNVMKTPITMSETQIDEFRLAYWGNSRPLQARNGRVILFDSSAGK